jgi:hypothetical protein
MNNFIVFFYAYLQYNNSRYTESEGKRMIDPMLTFIPSNIFALLYSRVGARAA